MKLESWAIRISEGHDIVDVSKQLGHHSEAITMKVCNHRIPGKRKSEIDSLEDYEEIGREVFSKSDNLFAHLNPRLTQCGIRNKKRLANLG